MFKIKLLILLLISIFLLSCTKNDISKNNLRFSMGYIGGEYDGYVLSNTLESYLKGFDVFDKNSRFEIQSSVSHSSNIYITNIDNTSDREKITSNLNLKILDKEKNCIAFVFNKNVSQFYIFASSGKFISNKKALEKIKYNNTDYLVKKFINKLLKTKVGCEE